MNSTHLAKHPIGLFSPPTWDALPDLGLYMDQVITYLDQKCRPLYPDAAPFITPAMVNNYVKFGLVSRPVDKKYGREQLAQLMMICVLKQSASADGMKALLTPPEGVPMQAHYEAFCQTEELVFESLCSALPYPNAMTCAVQGAAYLFLCNALLARLPEPKAEPEPKPSPKPEGRHAPKPAAETAPKPAQEGAPDA